MQRYFWVLAPALVGGCGLPPAVMIASYAADGVSYVATGKSVTDHGISEVTGRDCALLRVIRGRAVCKDEPAELANPAPVEAGQQATLPAETASASTVVAGRQRYLVLGSFVDARNAARLAAGHHDRRVEVASVDGRLTHRVIAGPLSNLEVTRLQQRLADEEQPRAWEIAALPPGS